MNERDPDDSVEKAPPRTDVHDRATRPTLTVDDVTAKATKRIPAPELGGLVALTGAPPTSRPPPLARPPNASGENIESPGSKWFAPGALLFVAVALIAVIVGGLLFLYY